jgi:hypothetical protein
MVCGHQEGLTAVSLGAKLVFFETTAYMRESQEKFYG